MTNVYTIVLQAGGQSTRMGRDKGLVPFLGTTLIGHILGQAAALSDDILVISNAPTGYRDLGLPVHGDVYRDWGALGGLHAALFHARGPKVLVLACDMPILHLGLIRSMAGLAADWDAVVPRLGESGFAEPFRSFYDRAACLPAIEAAIRAGKRRVNSFFDDVRLRYVEQPEIEGFDPELLSFTNANTPEELARAESIASGLPKIFGN